MDKNKIINIVLIALSVIVLCSCAYLIFTTKPQEGSETILLKDMNMDDFRVISDKTDVDSNAGGTIHIKGEKPTDSLNPEDVFKEVIKQVGKNEITKEEVYIGDKNVGELKMPEPGEDVEVLEEIIIEEPKEEEKKTPNIPLEMILRDLRQYRNKDTNIADIMISILTIKGEGVLVKSLTDKPILIIPFSIGNQKDLDYIKSWMSIYEKYNEKINFVFLNTSMDMVENYDKIMTALTINDINVSIPLYYDNYYELLYSLGQDNVSSYWLLNSEGRIEKKGQSVLSEKELNSIISKIAEDKIKYDNQVEEIKKIYEEGKFVNYSDIDMYIENVVDGKPIVNIVEEE